MILIVWLLLARNKPEGAPDLPVLPITRYLREAARSRAIWLAGICAFLVMGAMMTFTSFLPNVLQDFRGISPVQAGFYGSLATLGGVFGSFLGPVVCSRIGYMKPYLIFVSLLGAASAIWSWQLPVGPAIVIALMAAGFLMSAILPLLLSLPMLVREIGPCMRKRGRNHHHAAGVRRHRSPHLYYYSACGLNATLLFGLAAVCYGLILIPALFLPELGARALAAEAKAPVTASTA